MVAVLRSPSLKNCQRQSSYLTDYEVDCIKAGKVLNVIVTDQLLNKTHTLNAMACVNALLNEHRKGSYGEDYRCFFWTDLLNENQPEVFSNLNVLTQVEVAERFGVDPSRVSQLHHFNFLQPSYRIGTKLLYEVELVDRCLKNPHIKHWMSALKSK